MATKFIGDQPWKQLQCDAKANAGKSLVAVAFLGTGAARLLPLTKGSILVVDFSEASVKRGLTNPDEVLKFLQRGVAVYTVGNLHAKVFVLGNKLYTGSTNASTNSEKHLLEATLLTTDRTAVAAARKYVTNLASEPVGIEQAKRLQKLFKPPQHGTPKGKTSRSSSVAPTHSPIWLVRTVSTSYSKEEKREAVLGMATAKQRRSNSRASIGRFVCHIDTKREMNALSRIQPNDLLVDVCDSSSGTCIVYPVSRVLWIRKCLRYKTPFFIIYQEWGEFKTKGVKTVIKRLGKDGKVIENLGNDPKLIKDNRLIHAILSALK